MLEASRMLLLLAHNFDISADISSPALGNIRSPAANNRLYDFNQLSFECPEVVGRP